MNAIDQRPQVLGQARSSEGEPRFQICRRNVQLHVLAQRAHHLLSIDAQPSAQRSHLVSERDLDGVECVTGILDHLSGAERNQASAYTERRVEIRHLLDGRLLGPSHHHQRWFHEILHRRAFAQELGVRHHAHLFVTGQRRQDNLFRGPGKNRTAYGDNQRFGTFGNLSRNLFYCPAQLRKSQISVLFRRRSDANHNNRGVRDSIGAGGGGQSAGSDIFANQILKSGLIKRSTAAVTHPT